MSDEPSAGPGATVRLFGVPIRVEPAFVLVLGVLGFAGRGTVFAAIEWILLAGISILLHELGHAAAYRRFGIRSRIRLWSFGGLTYGEEISPAPRSLSRSGDPAGAVTWLGRAVERGLTWSEIDRHEDFASLAGNPAFEAIRSSDAAPSP